MSAPTAFVGSIPRTYHTYLVPLLFEAYARDMVARLNLRPGERILELAAGTGVVTRQIARSLPAGASLTATDLNQAMLDVARPFVGDSQQIEFRQADACDLPFPDRSFDALACQFGVMFFPDKLRAMREARRVLSPGGRYVFSIWDSLEHNPIPRAIHATATALFPANPPNFLAAAPYGCFDRAEIERVVRAAGFARVAADSIVFPCTAPTAEDAARAFVEGTPLLVALQERGMTDPTPARRAAAEALAKEFGDRPCRATMRALVFEAV